MNWVRSIIKTFAFSSVAVPIGALYGHWMAMPQLYNWSGEGSMSIPTSIHALCVSLCLILVCYDKGQA